MQSDEGTSSTRALKKTRRNRRSHLSDVIRARLRPQVLGVEGQPCILKTLRARLGQPTAAITSEWLSQPPR